MSYQVWSNFAKYCRILPNLVKISPILVGSWGMLKYLPKSIQILPRFSKWRHAFLNLLHIPEFRDSGNSEIRNSREIRKDRATSDKTVQDFPNPTLRGDVCIGGCPLFHLRGQVVVCGWGVPFVHLRGDLEISEFPGDSERPGDV